MPYRKPLHLPPIEIMGGGGQRKAATRIKRLSSVLRPEEVKRRGWFIVVCARQIVASVGLVLVRFLFV